MFECVTMFVRKFAKISEIGRWDENLSYTYYFNYSSSSFTSSYIWVLHVKWISFYRERHSYQFFYYFFRFSCLLLFNVYASWNSKFYISSFQFRFEYMQCTVLFLCYRWIENADLRMFYILKENSNVIIASIICDQL